MDLEKIPVPEGVDFIQWLKIYPATGYIVTAAPENASRCIELFEEVGITACIIGEITNKRLTMIHKKDTCQLFDFNKDIITGITL